MKRRTVIRALGTPVVLAGCVTDESAGGRRDRVANRFDSVERPTCTAESEMIEIEYEDETREYETAETVPYPAKPETFTEGVIVDFVEAFEEAYVTHDVLCDRQGADEILGVRYDARSVRTLDRDGDYTTVFLRRAGHASGILHDDGSVSAADTWYDSVVYAIDESGAARTDADVDGTPAGSDELESRTPDPLEEGTLVARFD